MLISEPVPSYVTPGKVLEWEQETPRPEGMHLVYTFVEACKGQANWLLFFCWCYARTNGFKDPCVREWDYGKLGEQYETSRDGARYAFLEFSKLEDTNMMPEQEEVERLYFEALKWCESEVHAPPAPEPPKPQPTEPPKPPEPVPEPQPEPEPTKPPPQAGGFDWRAVLRIGLPILKGIAAVAGAFLPGWVKIVLDVLFKVADNLS